MKQVNWNKALEFFCFSVKVANAAADIKEFADNLGGEDADAIAEMGALVVENCAE